MKWTLEEAVTLATQIEAIAPNCGAHIGLTGGVLYKDGPRKDLDIVVYRIRQVERIDREKFFAALRLLGIEQFRGYGFVEKTKMNGRNIDFLFPDHADGEYPQ